MASIYALGPPGTSEGDHNVAGLGNPPTEILIKILGHLAPSSPLSTPAGVDRAYARRRSQFSKLRLVSAAWNEPVLELLLETTFLFMRGSNEDTLRNLKVLEHHPNLIKILEIEATFALNLGPKNDFNKIAAEIIDRGLASCSNLREIRFIGNNFRFLDRQWPRKTCPNLMLMVTSVKLRGVSTKRCSAVLDGLGRELTNLEISSPFAFFGRGRMSMPSKLPRLSSLIWENSAQHLTPLVSKLASRIVHEREDLHAKKISPLRHLSLHDDYIDTAMTTNILTTNNIGAGLTSFHYACRFLTPSDTGLAITMLKLCRGLTDFTFGPPCSGDIFTYLPRTIKRLNITIVVAAPQSHHHYPYTLSDPIHEFEKYLAIEPRTLEHMTINAIHARGGSVDRWTSLLKSVNIPLVWLPRVRQPDF